MLSVTDAMQTADRGPHVKTCINIIKSDRDSQGSLVVADVAILAEQVPLGEFT